MVYEFRKEEIDCVGDVYRINVDDTKYLLFLSPTPDRKGNKLRWVIYLIDKNGDVLSDASAPFGSTSFKNVTEELLGHLADKVKKKIGIDFSDTFMDILALNMGTEN
jgi:MoaA/NifB/PqqE/SkfB family radical SAM enzyme